MNQIVYHEVAPMNDNSNGFEEHDTIRFQLEADGRAMHLNSLRLDFDVQAFRTGSTRIAPTDLIFYDHRIGGHTFISSTTVENLSGQIEHVGEYSRFVATHSAATRDNNNSAFDSCAQAEGRGCVAENTNQRLQPVSAKSDGADAATKERDPSFTIKPMVCLNRGLGGSYSFSKNGPITVGFTCQRNGMAMHGPDVTASTYYKLQNVRLRFRSSPDEGKQEKLMMNSVVNVKQSATSSMTSIDARVPSQSVGSVLINFISQADETTVTSNANSLQQYPLLDELRYNFNDTLSGAFLSFTLKSRSEMVRRALEALSDAKFSKRLNTNVDLPERFEAPHIAKVIGKLKSKGRCTWFWSVLSLTRKILHRRFID